MMLSSEATPEPPHSPSHDSRSTDPPPTTCASECPFTEPGLNFTNSDLSLVDMSEVEYTQLQHILYSHMESQPVEGELETRLNPTLYQSTNLANQAPFPTASSVNQVPYSTASSTNQNLYPVTSATNPTSDSHYVGNSQCLGHIDFQELKMMLLNDPPLPVNSSNSLPNVEKFSQNSSAETARPNGLTLKNRDMAGNSDKEKNLGENSMAGQESRCKTGPRVRLEDRFNAIQNENQDQQELQDSGVTFNNLVALIRHPSELMGIPLHPQQNKCTTLVKSKAGAPSALQFAYPLYTPNTCTPTGSTSSSQTQQELQSARQALSNCNRSKPLPEQVWIKVEDETLRKQVTNKRCRNRSRQTSIESDHKVLSDLTNMTENQNSNVPQGGQWQPAHPTPPGPTHGNQQELNCQRRERHNRMERDRRRRIRICCDELNYLVPFCNSETDKATTLQWTTAFLKYIQEKHGDTLKKEFESVFCGKTGRRLKQPRLEAPVDHLVTTSLHNHGVMEGK
ncbi:transcription factor-like 5 protein isoform X2 [Chiloscyllium plagiosum]|uniref:transcription factor-like 5 protein isoform X2 n=1 Tax=Chiloscyllium plagiosum TaxID=36176 RepID=UPI001CB7C78E|nr:transcription factor-like 5 protein isoform X2 [Chiloscyllium plagiosum]